MRMEEKFIELITEKLKKQWQGVVDTKQTTVNKRKKIITGSRIIHRYVYNVTT
jgi:hypothetical protein